MAQTYSEQLAAAQAQLDDLLASPIDEHVNAHGERFRRRKIEELTKLIEWLSDQVNASSGPALNLADMRRKP